MTETTLLMENFYILDDGRVRQFLITGEDEALLIDTGFEDSHVYEAVRKITDLPVRVVLRRLRFPVIHMGAWRLSIGRKNFFCPVIPCRKQGRFLCSGVTGIWIFISKARKRCALWRIRWRRFYPAIMNIPLVRSISEEIWKMRWR